MEVPFGSGRSFYTFCLDSGFAVCNQDLCLENLSLNTKMLFTMY